jgi:hypothetical protein
LIFKIKEKPKYEILDTKVKEKFAIFPIKINSSTVIWLEKYYVKYQLRTKVIFDYSGGWTHQKYWEKIDSWCCKA